MTNSVTQFGDKSIYIDKHEGNIYIGAAYVIDAERAFEKGSFELEMYLPTINPPIERSEVDSILGWIEQDADEKDPNRVGVLYGKAGIGKSVVMHELLQRLIHIEGYKVLGLKSDQIEFTDTDTLSQQLHLPKPIEEVIETLAASSKRVILLIDQIDALSLSLSTNRTPLRSLLKLIQRIQFIKNVRVVISSRPYDLEYDPTLEQLKIKNRWELKEFSFDIVKQVLKQHGYNKSIGNDVLLFLGNPLHLHLFLKVFKTAQIRYPLTEEDLYDQLWRLYIIDNVNEKISKESIISLLDVLVNRMYERQELSVRQVSVETDFDREIRYLQHCEILTLTQNGQLQFFHQTMFDYVFARRFTETKRNLLEELKGKHQGLFIRSAVKSIMAFMRSSDPSEYKKTITHLLFDLDENNEHVYRFHLRSLVLSSMAYFEEPIKEEINLIDSKLLQDEDHLPILLDAIHNVEWFNVIRSIFGKHYDWKCLSKDLKDRMMGIGRRIVSQDLDAVLDFANEVLDYGLEEDLERVAWMLDLYDLNNPGQKLIQVYNRITTSRNPLQNLNILRNLVATEPHFVMNELRTNICLQLDSQENGYLTEIKLNHFEEEIYDLIEKRHPALVVDFYLDLLKLILSKDAILVDSHDIKLTIKTSCYERCKHTEFSHDMVDTLINKILDRIETDIDIDKDYHEELLDKLANEDYDGLVYIALCGYKVKPKLFIDKIHGVLVNRKLLANAPSIVEYQAAELLRVSYPLFNRDQKNAIINLIVNISDEREKKNYFKIPLIQRLEYNRPLLRTGHRKGVLLNLLPIDDLKSHYWEAYQELLRLKRRFPHDQALENKPPHQSSFMSGWPSMKKEKAEHMNDETWKNSMRTYNTDSHHDWNTPSLSGQQLLLEELTKKEPEQKFKLLMEVVPDQNIPLSYPIHGLKGLLETGRIDLAEKLFVNITKEIGEDINTQYRNYSLHSFLFALDGFMKSDKLPQPVFDFICKATLEAKEDLSYRGEPGDEIYNRGINLPRGNAGYKIIECCKYKEYAEKIFTTLEAIAMSASEFTRAAILLNFAALNTLDKDRSVKLFLSMMHDYHPSLMSLPVHNYNPLVYYVNYAFDDLVPFFEKALEIEICHIQQVIILWLAWTHTHKSKAKELLEAMCERTETARISLIHFLRRLDNGLDKEASVYLCGFMQDKYYSEEMANSCDNVFHDLEKVSVENQKLLAETFVNSKMSCGKVHCFYTFLATFALINPVQSLSWLKKMIEKEQPLEYNDWNVITDIIIQSYNGIKSFDDEENKPLLDMAMDLLDKIMQRQENKYILNNFIQKLDNE
jgi:hypothetical protein